MKRRDLLVGGAAAGAAAALGTVPALGVDRARREFRIIRDGDDIGRHVLEARLDGDEFEIAIEIDIKVKVLGITAYRYRLVNRERWKGGQIVSVDTTTDDDGDDHFARIRRDGGLLRIEGSGYSGSAPLEAVTTSYFARPMIDRRPWISTQTGTLLEVETRPASGKPNTYDVTGELETQLAYDTGGEWLGCSFDAGGELATYDMLNSTGAIVPLWKTA